MEEKENFYGHDGHHGKKHIILKVIGWIIGGILLAVVFGFVFGWVVQQLWNWLMPGLFGLKMITFWQAVVIIILGKIIFGMGIHPKHHGHNRSKWHHHGKHWGKKGDWDKWRHYDEFWKEEGHEAFEKFVEKKTVKKED